MKKKLFLLILSLIGTAILFSDNISISGIDTTGMIFDGNISLYLNITDSAGLPSKGVTADQLEILESTGDDTFSDRKISYFAEGENSSKGINFQLLIDNSGSMYETINGLETSVYEETRISSAISAIKTLMNSMEGSKDKAGVAYFNTYYKELVPISANRNLVLESLQKIEKPGKDESFTELNAALYSAAGNISSIRGRKIIIVLSDGENYPFSTVRKKDSPQFGSDLYAPEDLVNELKLNGATLYGINFGSRRDPSLERVVIETGGFLYEADSEQVLTDIYKNIRERVLSEYYVEFKTDTVYSERKFIKAVLKDGSAPSGIVFYFSGNLFGNPSIEFNWLFMIVLPLAFCLLVILAYQKLSAPAEKAELEVTDFSGATQVFDIKGVKTVIGNSDSDDITLVTETQAEENNATIVYDEKKALYKVISDKEVLVNNNPVTTRILEPGDVINIEGATIIFNDKE